MKRQEYLNTPVTFKHRLGERYELKPEETRHLYLLKVELEHDGYVTGIFDARNDVLEDSARKVRLKVIQDQGYTYPSNESEWMAHAMLLVHALLLTYGVESSKAVEATFNDAERLLEVELPQGILLARLTSYADLSDFNVVTFRGKLGVPLVQQYPEEGWPTLPFLLVNNLGYLKRLKIVD